MQIVSNGDTLHEMSFLVSEKKNNNKKNIITFWSAEFAQRVVKIKGSIFLINKHFIIQEKFNKLIYGINATLKCGTWQPVKFQLVPGY